jgi:hypothetical protein
MTEGDLPYDQWIEDALRGVIRRALAYVAADGLPGNHHFYITFATQAAGVDIAPELRARYPNEMTIVLQHQFWDLQVDDDAVAVTLKFHGRSARLYIPLKAISAFGDPSVNFGVQLHPELPASDNAGPAAPPPAAALSSPPAAEVIALDTFRKK